MKILIKIGIVVIAALLLVGMIFIFFRPAEVDARIGYIRTVVQLPAVVAAEHNYYEKEGIKVEAKVFASGAEAIEALVGGHIDIALVADGPWLTLLDRGGEAKAIALYGYGAARIRVMIPTDSNITSLKELEGKSVAWKKPTICQTAFLLLAEKYDVDLTKIILRDVPVPEMPAALAAGEVDAVVPFEPTCSLIEAGGIGKELINASVVGDRNEFPGVIIVRKGFADSRPEIVVKVLRAYVKAVRYVEENLEEAAALYSDITKLDVEVVKKVISLTVYEVDIKKIEEEFLVWVQNTAEFLLEVGSIKSIPDYQNYIDTSYLEQALQEPS